MPPRPNEALATPIDQARAIIRRMSRGEIECWMLSDLAAAVEEIHQDCELIAGMLLDAENELDNAASGGF